MLFIRVGLESVIMSDECGYCNEQTDEVVDRPDLMDPYGEESPETTMVCKRCEHVLERKKEFTFVCGECGHDHDGLMVIHDSFGTFCKTCYNKEGWEKPSLTPIPEDGWTQADIGRHVYIRGDHGVIIPDIVICSTLPHGKTVIGPGHTVGGILARMDHVNHVQERSEGPNMASLDLTMGGDTPPGFDDFVAEIFRMLSRGDDDDDEDGGSGDLIP